MIYIFNKNKIFSYIVASFIVLLLFVFSTSIIPNDDIQLLKVSANSVNNQTYIYNNLEE